MTRLWTDGRPIEVATDPKGRPVALAWQEQRCRVRRTVGDIGNRWRVADDWWRRPIHRDYFLIETTEKFLYVIYHDRVTKQWYLERIYD